MTEMLIRSMAPEEVRYERREIDVLAVPYDIASAVRDPSGNAYLETIAPGAFGDVAARAKRVKVFRDHRPDRAVGKCVHIDGSHPDGLHATLQMSRTPLGDESLALAADGVLDVSIGFSSRTETWSPDRSSVVRTSCWLHELSLVPLPAYETATVLAVRHQQPGPPPPVGTPNLDEVLAWLTARRYLDDATISNHRDEVSPPLTTA